MATTDKEEQQKIEDVLYAAKKLGIVNSGNRKDFIDYLFKNPKEMDRLWFLRKENPYEFRATVSNLVGSAIRHPIEFGEFVLMLMGLSVAGSMCLAFLFHGAAVKFRGAAAYNSNNPLNIIEARFNAGSRR